MGVLYSYSYGGDRAVVVFVLKRVFVVGVEVMATTTRILIFLLFGLSARFMLLGSLLRGIIFC
jgi:hypothetical protein